VRKDFFLLSRVARRGFLNFNMHTSPFILIWLLSPYVALAWCAFASNTSASAGGPSSLTERRVELAACLSTALLAVLLGTWSTE
jgi:hypothetical protein